MRVMGEQLRIVVLHSLPEWLSQTQTWLFTQVTQLPREIESHICCQRVRNLDQFPIANIWCFENQPRWRQFLGLAIRKLSFSRLLPFLTNVARRSGAQIVHSHFGLIGWQDSETARRLGLAHVVTFYGFDVGFLPRTDPRWIPRYRKMFQRVDAILCEGPHMAGRLVDLGCPKGKIRIHHLGVAVDKIAFQPRTWVGNTPLRVLLCGTFVEKKGLPFALAALGELQGRVGLEITVIGDANNEPRSRSEKQRILDVVAEYNLESKVRFLGFQPYRVVLQEGYQHHLFLSPSVTSGDGDTEGGAPLTIVEMSATGMPVISTDHCADHGRAGWLILAAPRARSGYTTSA